MSISPTLWAPAEQQALRELTGFPLLEFHDRCVEAGTHLRTDGEHMERWHRTKGGDHG